MARTKRLNFGVEKPLTIEHPQDNDWHVWMRGDHGDVWQGFFKDATTALEWAKAQHGNYVVNNVPPPTSPRYKPILSVSRGRFTEPGVTPTKTGRVKPAQSVRETKRSIPAAPVAKPDNSEEAKVLRKQAKARLDKHVRDEAADIAAGRTEG